MTYSIVAREAETGRFGVAVQTHLFGVGRIVPWARAGVGAVATQSFADTSYGPLGLALMADEGSAEDALQKLVDADSDAAIRQVAMVDAQGRTAVHTGERCVREAGHRCSNGVSAQANMMASPTVWDAMIEAYEQTAGDLADRLLAALDAAEAEGGDIRGRQSAAMLVVSPSYSERPWSEVAIDIRVEDHEDPVKELRRLVSRHRAYELLGAAIFGPGLIAGEFAATAAEVDDVSANLSRAQEILGDNPEPTLWQGVLLARAGRLTEAKQCFERAVAATPDLAELLRRFPESGLLPSNPNVLSQILPPNEEAT